MLRQHLKATMDYGTGTRAKVEGYDIGAKREQRKNFRGETESICYLISVMRRRTIRKS